jgi:predicted hotdog family 3-hydroxylacyl-ACP dehydratase
MMDTLKLEPTPLTAEELLPHRSRMLLVDEILLLDDDQATTLSVARRDWPMYKNGVISPLIMVELVAQAAGVHNGRRRMKTRGKDAPAHGWLVGVKSAVFHIDAIALGASVTTTAKNAFVFENLREIAGRASIDGRLAAEVVLQVVEAEEGLNADSSKQKA